MDKEKKSTQPKKPQPPKVSPEQAGKTPGIRRGIVKEAVAKFGRPQSTTSLLVEMKEGGFDFDPSNIGYQKYLLQENKNPFEIELTGVSADDAFDFLLELKGTANQKSGAALVASRRFDDPAKAATTLSTKTFKTRSENLINALLNSDFSQSPNLSGKYTVADAALAILTKKVQNRAIDATKLPRSAAELILRNELNLIVAQIQHFLKNQSFVATAAITKQSNPLGKFLEPLKKEAQEKLDESLEYPQLVWKSQKEAATKSGAKWNQSKQAVDGGGIHFALLQPARKPFISKFLTGEKKEKLKKMVLARWQSVALEAFEARLFELASKFKSGKTGAISVAMPKFDGGTGEGKTFLAKLIQEYYGADTRVQDVAVVVDFIDLNSSQAKIAELAATPQQNGKISGVKASTAVKCVVIDENYFNGPDFLSWAGIKDANDLQAIEDKKEAFTRSLAQKGILVVIAGATEHPDIYKIAAVRNIRKSRTALQQIEDAQNAAYPYEKIETAILDAVAAIEIGDIDNAQAILRAALTLDAVRLIYPKIEEKNLPELINGIIEYGDPSKKKEATKAIKEILDNIGEKIAPFKRIIEDTNLDVESRDKKIEQKETVEKRMRDKREFAKTKVRAATFVKPIEGTSQYQNISTHVTADSSTLYVVPQISAKENFGLDQYHKICGNQPCVVIVPFFKNLGKVNQELGYKICYIKNDVLQIVNVEKQADGSIPVDKEYRRIKEQEKIDLPRIVIYDNTTAVGGDVGGLALGVKKVVIQCDTTDGVPYDKSLDDIVQFIGRDRDDDKSKLEVVVISNQEKDSFVNALQENTVKQDKARLEAYLGNKKNSKAAQEDNLVDLTKAKQELDDKKQQIKLGAKGRYEQAEADRLEAEEQHQRELVRIREQAEREARELELAKTTAAQKELEAKRAAEEKLKRARELEQERLALEKQQEEKRRFEEEKALSAQMIEEENKRKLLEVEIAAQRAAAERRKRAEEEAAQAGRKVAEIDALTAELEALYAEEGLAKERDKILKTITPIENYVTNNLLPLQARIKFLIKKHEELEKDENKDKKTILTALDQKIKELETIDPTALLKALETIKLEIGQTNSNELGAVRKKITEKDKEAKELLKTMNVSIDETNHLFEALDKVDEKRQEAKRAAELAEQEAELARQHRAELDRKQAELTAAERMAREKEEEALRRRQERESKSAAEKAELQAQIDALKQQKIDDQDMDLEDDDAQEAEELKAKLDAARDEAEKQSAAKRKKQQQDRSSLQLTFFKKRLNGNLLIVTKDLENLKSAYDQMMSKSENLLDDDDNAKDGIDSEEGRILEKIKELKNSYLEKKEEFGGKILAIEGFINTENQEELEEIKSAISSAKEHNLELVKIQKEAADLNDQMLKQIEAVNSLDTDELELLESQTSEANKLHKRTIEEEQAKLAAARAASAAAAREREEALARMQKELEMQEKNLRDQQAGKEAAFAALEAKRLAAEEAAARLAAEEAARLAAKTARPVSPKQKQANYDLTKALSVAAKMVFSEKTGKDKDVEEEYNKTHGPEYLRKHHNEEVSKVTAARAEIGKQNALLASFISGMRKVNDCAKTLNQQDQNFTTLLVDKVWNEDSLKNQFALTLAEKSALTAMAMAVANENPDNLNRNYFSEFKLGNKTTEDQKIGNLVNSSLAIFADEGRFGANRINNWLDKGIDQIFAEQTAILKQEHHADQVPTKRPTSPKLSSKVQKNRFDAKQLSGLSKLVEPVR